MQENQIPDNNPIERRSISMYQIEWEILETVSRDKGLNNVSAANRMIIREWSQLKAHQPIAIPER